MLSYVIKGLGLGDIQKATDGHLRVVKGSVAKIFSVYFFDNDLRMRSFSSLFYSSLGADVPLTTCLIID